MISHVTSVQGYELATLSEVTSEDPQSYLIYEIKQTILNSRWCGFPHYCVIFKYMFAMKMERSSESVVLVKARDYTFSFVVVGLGNENDDSVMISGLFKYSGRVIEKCCNICREHALAFVFEHIEK